MHDVADDHSEENPEARRLDAANRCVREFVGVSTGDFDLSVALPRVDPNITMNLDGSRFFGRRAWANFVSYLNKERARKGLRLIPERVTTDGDIATLEFRWEDRGAVILRGTPRFHIVDDRVVELWTRRAYYEPAFGWRIVTWPGQVLLSVQMWVWAFRRWLRPRSDRHPDQSL